MRNPLQEQLLKAGLVKKSKVAEVAREQAKARHGKQPIAPTQSQRDAARARHEKAERDRALAHARNEDARERERRAQARQMIADGRIDANGDRAYRFDVDGGIRSLSISDTQAGQLASGALVIARLDDGFVLLSRSHLNRIRERDPGAIVLDHGNAAQDRDSDDGYDDPRYAVPDDLVW